jgi:hypothetical protein
MICPIRANSLQYSFCSCDKYLCRGNWLLVDYLGMTAPTIMARGRGSYLDAHAVELHVFFFSPRQCQKY